MGVLRAVAAICLGTVLAPSVAQAAVIPGSEQRETYPSISGDFVFWSVPSEPIDCPDGSQPGHPWNFKPKIYRSALAFDLRAGTTPAWSGAEGSPNVTSPVDAIGVAFEQHVSCATPWDSVDLGWFNTRTGTYAPYDRWTGADALAFDAKAKAMIDGELIAIRWAGDAIRLDAASGRLLKTKVAQSAVPRGKIARAANGDFVWIAGSSCGASRIYRWSGTTNRVTSVPASSRMTARPAMLSSRTIVDDEYCNRWLDPDRGTMLSLLRNLDEWRFPDGVHGVDHQSGPWTAANVSRGSTECCDLVLDTRTGEWRKVPPPPARLVNHGTRIRALTGAYIVWETLDPRGVPVGPLQYDRITNLKKAIDLVRVTRDAASLTFHYKSYGNPGRPQVYRFSRGTWEPVKEDRVGTGTITIEATAERQWYWIYKGGFVSRRVRA